MAIYPRGDGIGNGDTLYRLAISARRLQNFAPGNVISRTLPMTEELLFKGEAAAEFDRAFAHVTRYFMPFLFRAADVTPGMRVLDIATGTGLSAAAALAAVGPTGHVTASDLSPAMVDKARERLGNAPNASVSVEDGQALSFLDGSFEAVLCNLGLMFFPDPVRGLSEFRRVLRPDWPAPGSVDTRLS